MRYLTLDGMPLGNGIRDTYEGGFIDVHELDLSVEFLDQLKAWLLDYEKEARTCYQDRSAIERLDEQGIKLAVCLSSTFPGYKIEYFSDGLSQRLYFKSRNTDQTV